MSSQNDGVKLKKFCQSIKEELKGEGKANIDYAKKAAEARKLNHPAAEMAATIYDLLAKQEASHDEALRKIQREVCPI